ncbi:hypothetical protein [Devosia sp.]|uniref:hypothetical protein n=1 Tax=Devosia sp. TaxID=1871048 RepID=UPI003A8D0369
MKRHAAALACLLALGTSVPARAQTDDRILNDVVEVVATVSALQAMGERCAAFVDEAPELVEGLSEVSRLNTAWVEIAIEVIAARGGLPDGVLEAESARQKAAYIARYDSDSQPITSCLQYAAGDPVLHVGELLPEQTRRLMGAHDGGYPVLDVDASVEVADALEMMRMFRFTDLLLGECNRRAPDLETYSAAWDEWYARNEWGDTLAKRVLKTWGVQDPARFEAIDEEVASEVDALFARGEGQSRCAAFVANVMAGSDAEDVTTIAPGLLERLQDAKGPDVAADQAAASR